MNDNRNHIVLVTGGSRGIGHGISRRFLQNGFSVAVGYCQHPEGAKELAREFPEALPVQIDLGDRKSICSALVRIREHFRAQVGILVNNGAIAQEKPFLTITDEDWDRMLKINLAGPFALTQEILPSMIETGWGRIINISSIGGQWGGFNQVHYAAAKAGLISFTRSMAKIYSADGITCNAIAPGLVETDMSSSELATLAGQEKVKLIPSRRLGNVEEVAAAVAFLASDEAGYITGQTLNLNGGMYFV